MGALCIANALADLGEVDLVAAVHNTGLPTGVGAISVIQTYYGRNISIGAYKGPFAATEAGVYVDDLVANFPSPIKNYTQVCAVNFVLFGFFFRCLFVCLFNGWLVCCSTPPKKHTHTRIFSFFFFFLLLLLLLLPFPFEFRCQMPSRCTAVCWPLRRQAAW